MEQELLPADIKKLRVRMGWCQSELAHKLSVEVEMIQQWEQGMNPPSSEHRKQLENLFIKSELSTLDMLSSAEHDADTNKS